VKIKFQCNTALKFILKQPLKQRERIFAAINRLPEGDIVPMSGMTGYHRLRVGDYRFVFSVDSLNDTIIIYHAGNRGDVYKGF